jgi:hypothetical protein
VIDDEGKNPGAASSVAPGFLWRVSFGSGPGKGGSQAGGWLEVAKASSELRL